MNTLPKLTEFPPRSGEFAPKLTFSQQCAIFIFYHHKNVPVSVLARAYGIHKRTVIHITRANSGKAKLYKRVAAELTNKGPDQMAFNHVTADDIERVNAAAAQIASMQNHELSAPSKAHNQHADELIRCNGGEFKAVWVDGSPLLPAGWYASFDGATIGRGGPVPFNTATECIIYMRQELNG